MKRIAIIGAGISGLTAALTLERARVDGAAIAVTLYESSPRLGGVLRTEQVDGCLIEAGPDSFLTEKSWGLDFCRSLGLGDQLIGSNDSERKTYILVRGRLIEIPDGLMFMVPTKLMPTVVSPLFSWGTKLRMGMEYLFPPKAPERNGDESVATLVERHFGPEMVDRLAEPLLSGVYGGRAAELSVEAVLPRFAQLEKQYGSLSRGMLAARKKMAAATKSAPPRPLFTSLRDGMQQLVDAVSARLKTTEIHTGVKIARLARAGEEWAITPEGGPASMFDAVILATPAWAASLLLAETSPELSGELAGINYSSSVTITMGYDMSDLATLPPGFGFLVPRSEGRSMLACTFVHKKFPHRAPPHIGLIRCFVGGAGNDKALDLSDDELLARVRKDLVETTGLKAEPRFARVYRWRRSMAQPGVGHPQRVERIKRSVEQLPGLALAGNFYRGIGVPDCIASGEAAAKSVAGISAGTPRGSQ